MSFLLHEYQRKRTGVLLPLTQYFGFSQQCMVLPRHYVGERQHHVRMAQIPQGKAWRDDAGCCTYLFPALCALRDMLEAGLKAADRSETLPSASRIQVKHCPSPLLACLACQLVFTGSRKDVNIVEDALRAFYESLSALTDPDLIFLLAGKYD